MKILRDDSSIPAFDALERKELVTLLATRIVQLPEMPKKVLAMYYHEGLRLTDIAARFNLTESRICQIHTQPVKQLRTYLFSVLDKAGSLEWDPANRLKVNPRGLDNERRTRTT